MTPEILRFAHENRQRFNVRPGRVLEVGSCNVNGSIREAFQPGAELYLGIDIAPGPGVDLVMRSQEIRQNWADGTFDTVLCCEMLEHDPMPWLTVEQLHMVLKPGGILLVTTPTFGFPLHRFPKDYFRYGEDAYHDFIFRGMQVLNLQTVLDPYGFPGICCIGQKPR
jgi:SAM-dependent methyltransferase